MQVWIPILIDDKERLEKVQRRATKISTKLSKLIYYQRQCKLELTSPKDNRVRGWCENLIQMFKIMKRLKVVKLEKDFSIKEWTRGQNLSCDRDSFKSRRRNDFAFFVGERHSFFVNRVGTFTTKCDYLFESKWL